MKPISSLYYIMLFILIILIIWVGYMYYKLQVSKKLVDVAHAFTIDSTNYTKTLLILGDSTAVGVGASTSSRSVPGLLANYLGATYVENYAVSGAEAHDLKDQVSKTERDYYDTVLIQIGANDIVRFHDAKTVTQEITDVLVPLRKKSRKIIFISAGNLGGAPLVPFFLRRKYTVLNLEYHKAFETFGKEHDITYVNVYMRPDVDPFILDPDNHFAADGFHPNDMGYKVWFDTIKKYIINDIGL